MSLTFRWRLIKPGHAECFSSDGDMVSPINCSALTPPNLKNFSCGPNSIKLKTMQIGSGPQYTCMPKDELVRRLENVIASVTALTPSQLAPRVVPSRCNFVNGKMYCEPTQYSEPISTDPQQIFAKFIRARDISPVDAAFLHSQVLSGSPVSPTPTTPEPGPGPSMPGGIPADMMTWLVIGAAALAIVYVMT